MRPSMSPAAAGKHHHRGRERGMGFFGFEGTADWVGLNQDLLIAIAERLPSIESYESFAGVCKSWKSAAREGHLVPPIFEGPWLMYAEKDGEEEGSREFSSISLGINRPLKIFLPEASKQRCLPCKDWLFVTSPDGIDASILHPLSRVQIHLPKLSTLRYYYHGDRGSLFIHRAVVSANPATNSDYVVILICGRTNDLVYCKSGDTSWTSADHFGEFDLSFSDIIYSDNNKKLYGYDHDNYIYSWDIHELNPTQIQRLSDFIPEDEPASNKSYLVELSGGKFLLVRKYFFLDDDVTFYRTERFAVVEVNTNDYTSVEVNDLGNKALFLGHNNSYFIECSEFNKCKPNCIYFSEDHYMDEYMDLDGGAGKDMGVYCVSDGSIRSLFDDKMGLSMITPPTWIGPSF